MCCPGCESCYDLVMQQVEDVREMRRNLTTLRDQLVSADVSEEVGPFRVRLDQAVEDVQHLLIYVSFRLCRAGNVALNWWKNIAFIGQHQKNLQLKSVPI